MLHTNVVWLWGRGRAIPRALAAVLIVVGLITD